MLYEPELREVLSSVDLHLEPERCDRRNLGRKAVVERDAPLALLALRLPKPRIEPRSQGVEDGADRAADALHEVDVLGVSACGQEDQLVKRRAASERELPREERVREDLDEDPGQDEVLLHLLVEWPRRPGTPVCDEGALDHSSGSTDSFTRTLHRASFAAPSDGRSGRSDTTRGL